MDELDGEWTSQAVEGGYDGGPDPDYVRATRALEEEGKRAWPRKGRRVAARPPLPRRVRIRRPRPSRGRPHITSITRWCVPAWGIGHDLAAQERTGDFLAEAVVLADPVERLLLQQLFLAHHAVGRLHVRAGAAAADPQVIVAFLAAAARLTAELRRLALALGGLPRQFRRQEGEAGREEAGIPPGRPPARWQASAPSEVGNARRATSMNSLPPS